MTEPMPMTDYDSPWKGIIERYFEAFMLEANTNPFAVVVMAHLQTQRTQQQPAERYAAKLKLAKMLYRRGYIRQDVLELFRFLDWILTLPTELEQQFRVELAQFEAEVKMEYVTSVERLAMEKAGKKGAWKKHASLS